MQTEVTFSGEHETMDEFRAFLLERRVRAKEPENIIKASSAPSKRHSVTFCGAARAVTTGILDFLNKRKELKIEVQVGTTTTIITSQDSEETIHKTISSHKGLRVAFTRSTG
jgi:hypothetical protein